VEKFKDPGRLDKERPKVDCKGDEESSGGWKIINWQFNMWQVLSDWNCSGKGYWFNKCPGISPHGQEQILRGHKNSMESRLKRLSESASHWSDKTYTMS